MRVLRLTFSLCGILLLAGCIRPHYAQRSPEFRGRVLDDATSKPVVHAKVALRDRPSVSANTDRTGEFKVPAKRFLQWTLYGPCAADLREVDSYGWDLVVSHRGYETTTVDVLKHRNLDDASNTYVAVEGALPHTCTSRFASGLKHASDHLGQIAEIIRQTKQNL